MNALWGQDGSMAEELYPPLFPPTFPLMPSESESRVLIIMTGGTICMQPSPEGLIPSPSFLDTHLSPRPSFNSPQATPLLPLVSYSADGEAQETRALRTPLSRYNRRILYTVQEMRPLLDSSAVSAPAWSHLARLLKANYAHYDAFLILHGTDSLAYTASALSFMLRNLEKPVILTGSQAPMAQLHSDATDNLLGALLIAGHFCIPEVGLFFRQKLYRGNRSTKASTDAFEAFVSPDFGPLAEIWSNGVKVHWNRVRKLKHGDGSAPPPLHILSHLGTAHVACLRLFPGIQPVMLDAVLQLPKLRGLVLETFGAGNAPIGAGEEDGGLLKVLRDATDRQNVIVGVSQCLQGSVSLAYAPARALRSAGMLAGGDMTTEAALAKLSFLLAGGDETEGEEQELEADAEEYQMETKAQWASRIEKVRQLMGISLRGEMTVTGPPAP